MSTFGRLLGVVTFLLAGYSNAAGGEFSFHGNTGNCGLQQIGTDVKISCNSTTLLLNEESSDVYLCNGGIWFLSQSSSHAIKDWNGEVSCKKIARPFGSRGKYEMLADLQGQGANHFGAVDALGTLRFWVFDEISKRINFCMTRDLDAETRCLYEEVQ
jgi:hypothetical protein